MEKLLIGEIVKPQGIKGEVKVKLFVDGFFSVQKIKTLYGEKGNIYNVSVIKDAFSGYAFIKFKGCDDRNGAELLRNEKLYALKRDILKESDRFFISDLIGLSVFHNGELLGVIKNVTSGNVDMFTIENGDKVLYMPFLKVLNPVVDLNAKTLTVSADNLQEIIYYES